MNKFFLFFCAFFTWVSFSSRAEVVDGVEYTVLNSSEARITKVNSNVTKLVIPKTIHLGGNDYRVSVNLSKDALADCENISEIHFHAMIQFNSSVFKDNLMPKKSGKFDIYIYNTETAYYTDFTTLFPNCKNVYFKDIDGPQVKGFANHPNLETVYFQNCNNPVALPGSFQNCKKLRTAEAGIELEKYWHWGYLDAKTDAFKGCEKLKEAHLGMSVDDSGFDPEYVESIYVESDETKSISNTNATYLSFDNNVPIIQAVSGVNSDFFVSGKDYAITTIKLPTLYNDQTFSIGDNAFKELKNLNKVLGCATSIGAHAFEGLNLTAENSCKNLWNLVQSIGESAFENAKLYHGNFNENKPVLEYCKTIGENAFKKCRDEYGDRFGMIVIGPATTTIGNHAFDGFTTDVKINSNDLTKQNYTSDYNLRTIFGDKEVTYYEFGEDVKEIGEKAMCCIKNATENAYIWGGYLNNVQEIGQKAFLYCQHFHQDGVLKLPAVRYIGEGAFLGCKLKTIELGTLDAVVRLTIDCGAFNKVTPYSFKIYNKDANVCSSGAFTTSNLSDFVDLSDQVNATPSDKNVLIITGKEDKAKSYRNQGYKFVTSYQRLNCDPADVNMSGGQPNAQDVQSVYDAMKKK